MTIPFRILILKPASETQIQAIHDTFYHINQVYNNWNPDSEVSKINRAPANQPLDLSPELSLFLHRCQEFVHLSKGRFDPSIAPVYSIWKKALDNNQKPDEARLEAAKEASGWSNFILEGSTLTKKHEECELDLGGVAKGYAVDLLIEALQKQGITTAFVEWGGEIRVLGNHPEGRPWRIYIANFDDVHPQSALEYLDISDISVATSGDYLQRWNVGSQVFTHIIDTTTMSPLQMKESDKHSVTVLAPTCFEADIVATWILSTPLEERSAIIQQNPSYKVLMYETHLPQPTNTSPT